MTKPWFRDVLLHSRAYIVSHYILVTSLLPRTPLARDRKASHTHQLKGHRHPSSHYFKTGKYIYFFSQNPKRPSSFINSKYYLFPLYRRVFHLWATPNTASSTEVQRPKKKANPLSLPHEISNFSSFHRRKEAWVGRNPWRNEEYQAFWNQQ